MAIVYGIADSERSFLDSLPREVKNINDIDKVKKEFERKIAKKETGFFADIKKWNYQRQINKFEKNIDSPSHMGAKGENKVIDELLKLDDSYHILCGVQIELSHYVTHNGQKNLKSAQMDVVVVCPKGVFMIEVKNWSDDYVKNYSGLNPYEQTQRAGKVLWIECQNIIKNARITNVLLSIKGNIGYDEKYRAVLVSSLDRINSFLEKRENVLDKKDVEKLVNNLKMYTTR